MPTTKHTDSISHALIALSVRGKKHSGKFFAVVDIDDFDSLSKYNWIVKTGKRGTMYAQRYDLSTRTYIAMHRHIMASATTNDKPFVDHKDGNGLNNRRCNLRVANYGDNNANTRRSTGSTSSHIGVRCRNGKWTAHISHNDKFTHLGTFKTESEAAMAYNNAALKYRGEFARLNNRPSIREGIKKRTMKDDTAQNEVKRYNTTTSGYGYSLMPVMEEDLDGDYVKFTDYDTLRKELEEVNLFLKIAVPKVELVRITKQRDEAVEVLEWVSHHANQRGLTRESIKSVCDAALKTAKGESNG